MNPQRVYVRFSLDRRRKKEQKKESKREKKRLKNDGRLLGDLKARWLDPTRNPEGSTLPTN
ncbi:hypothetical protein K0M31_019908 [Melipona bicolor]|uniref:Uncharacterized protein n=1 Tax=Melipona bicolor TaxID=60889 RepID=A0AA40KQ73_9HYME|nr:hypothetical protein K0M31_019908 [Melipona bicolor]